MALRRVNVVFALRCIARIIRRRPTRCQERHERGMRDNEIPSHRHVFQLSSLNERTDGPRRSLAQLRRGFFKRVRGLILNVRQTGFRGFHARIIRRRRPPESNPRRINEGARSLSIRIVVQAVLLWRRPALAANSRQRI